MACKVNWEDIQFEYKLGSGGFGVVYKAIWATKKQVVAIKLNTQDDESDILKELNSLLKANHENIVKIIGETKCDKGRTAIVMEYAADGSLHNFLHNNGKEQRPYSYYAALNWMQQCAAGIAYLHEMNPKVLHRDLKPQNVLLFDNYKTLKLCDLGLTRPLKTIMSQAIRGTAEYIAPEVTWATGQYTEKCDIYSFGIILWEVLSRKKPFYHIQNGDPIAIINMAANLHVRPDLGDVGFKKEHTIHLKELIKMCWNKEPSERPCANGLKFIFSIDPRYCDPITILKLKPLPKISDMDFKRN